MSTDVIRDEERIPRLTLLWLGVVLVAALIVSAVAMGYMMVRAALHEGGWLKSGDRIVANGEVVGGNLAATSTVIAKGAGPMMESLNQGGVKMQMAMDSLQDAAEEFKDLVGNIRDDAGEALDLIGSGTRLVDHVTAQVDKVHAEKIDAAVDAVRDLGTEGKVTETAATTWLNAGTTTMTAAGKLLADTDPLMVNSGKISGDGYVYLHKILAPDKGGKLSKTDYLKAAGFTALKLAPPGAEFLYYLSNIHHSETVVVAPSVGGAKAQAQGKK